jgi:hypothetical protein
MSSFQDIFAVRGIEIVDPVDWHHTEVQQTVGMPSGLRALDFSGALDVARRPRVARVLSRAMYLLPPGRYRATSAPSYSMGSNSGITFVRGKRGVASADGLPEVRGAYAFEWGGGLIVTDLFYDQMAYHTPTSVTTRKVAPYLGALRTLVEPLRQMTESL